MCVIHSLEQVDLRSPVVRRYLGLGDFSEWSEDARMEWLVKELQSKRPLVPPAMPLTGEVKEVRPAVWDPSIRDANSIWHNCTIN